jgi:trehalose synthase
MLLEEIRIGSQPLERFLPLAGEEAVREALAVAARAHERMENRVLWHINSTALGGGVAELLRSTLAYSRGAGVDTRWLVIQGSPEFFAITKRLHHAIHGSRGDDSPLGDGERTVYEEVLEVNARALSDVVSPHDIVVLHDPQTAGLAPPLLRTGAAVVWRCHVGSDQANEETTRAWAFIAPYLTGVTATVFSRESYITDFVDRERAFVIAPSIDPFSAKNQELDEDTVRSVLVHTGIIEGPPDGEPPIYRREDGSPGRVDRHADVVRLGRAPSWETPVAVQISRWDVLKDHAGVMHGFADLVDGMAPAGAELILAGPNVTSVADDPEQAAVLDDLIAAWRGLSHAERNRIHLACLPTADVEENATIVNCLQRHASVVIQKSLQEGFGLVVTEAMWKARPIVASAVGGIRDQIVDGEHGLLVEDPRDLDGFAAALRRLLEDRPLAERLGCNARERVRQEYLGLRHLTQYAQLLERIDV